MSSISSTPWVFLTPLAQSTITDAPLLQIWLGGQTLMGIELGWAGEKWVGTKGPGVGGGVRGAVVASYHTFVPSCPSLSPL